MNNASFPKIRPTSLRELSPVIHWARQHVRTPQFKWSRRIYDFELLYVKHGEIQATIEGETFLVRAGSLLALTPWKQHRIEVLTEPHAELLGVHFDFFDGAAASHAIIADEQHPNPDAFSDMPYLTADNMLLFDEPLLSNVSPKIVALLENIIQEWNDRHRGYDSVCKGLMLQLIALLLRHQSKSSAATLPKYERSLLELVQAIRSDCSRRWSSAEMAKFLLVHEDYMSRQFKAMMGVGPNKFVQGVRHQEAKKLLRETDQTVEWIAGAVGYEDFHYFSRMFRKWEGMSAMQFRRMSRTL
ncbi:helix-turn-helix domain-containing protein [Paenibacillus silvisoli]|uniref:helix-turn-helix domain-containing protein n=1 Tax=Paenibacillus silvisoli TaxID=3110539 RepID=UPI0028051E5E|nr:helix-turn-helix domain-containing protein [Paenibacillus silvisoli]